MNKNQKVLNTALRGLLSRLEKTEKFALEQAPDICKQMVQERKQDNIMRLVVAGFLLLVFSGVSAFLLYKGTSLSGGEKAGCYLFGLLSLACVGGAGNSIYLAIQWILMLKNCPKLFLLREFRNLLN